MTTLREGRRETMAGPSPVPQMKPPVAALSERRPADGNAAVRRSTSTHPRETASRQAHNLETPGSTPGGAMGTRVNPAANGPVAASVPITLSSPAAATVGGAHDAGSLAASGQESGVCGGQALTQGPPPAPDLLFAYHLLAWSEAIEDGDRRTFEEWGA